MFGMVINVIRPRVLSTAPAVVDRFMQETVEEVSAQALADVHRLLDINIKKPTPYYETQIMIDRQGNDLAIVHDRGVIYGPWLEGVSARNASTKFKGYHAFRRATNGLVGQVDRLIKPAIDRMLARLK